MLRISHAKTLDPTVGFGTHGSRRLSVPLCRRVQNAFTLIELLVVVSIIALLVSILLPALGKARSQAKQVVCGSNLKQLGTIWIMYATENNDVLPPVQSGGSWNLLYEFVGDFMKSSYKITDGGIFYCPDYIFPTDSSGNRIDFDNPRVITGSTTKAYVIGYDIFTNVISTPYNGRDPLAASNLPWRNADGVSGSISWAYAYTAARDPKLENIIPASKLNRKSHPVSPYAGAPAVEIPIIPASTPMLFDHCYSRDRIFTQDSTRHLDRGKNVPYGRNAVFLDSHVEWKNFSNMGVFRYIGNYNNEIHEIWN